MEGEEKIGKVISQIMKINAARWQLTLSQVPNPTDSWYFRIHFQFLYRAVYASPENKKKKHKEKTVTSTAREKTPLAPIKNKREFQSSHTRKYFWGRVINIKSKVLFDQPRHNSHN